MKNNEKKIRDVFLFWNRYRLPTSDDVLFNYFLNLLEEPMGLKSEYELFTQLISEEYGNDVNLFLEEVYLVKEQIKKRYDYVIVDIINNFDKRKSPINGVVYTTCYNLPNGEYLKIDLCDAFTTSMFKYGYFNHKTWCDFINDFSDKKIFKLKNTKILLLKLYSDLASSVYLLHGSRIRDILFKTNKLQDIINFNGDSILYITGDSININVNNINDNMCDILKIKNIFGHDIHCSIFKMEDLYFTNGYYIKSKKDLFTNKITYFSDEGQSYYLPLIYKLHNNIEINDNDMYYGFGDCILKIEESFKLLK